jgi:Zn finger protein HypA/HybF involved in hydrogenase expression
VAFDHGRTGFNLEGTHARQSCIACHKPDVAAEASLRVAFAGLKRECTACHENIHRSQFEMEGVTDCVRCHGYEHWKPGAFDHNTARFVLEGAHLTVACAECHRESTDTQGNFVLYRLEKYACVDCHLQ